MQEYRLLLDVTSKENGSSWKSITTVEAQTETAAINAVLADEAVRYRDCSLVPLAIGFGADQLRAIARVDPVVAYRITDVLY